MKKWIKISSLLLCTFTLYMVATSFSHEKNRSSLPGGLVLAPRVKEWRCPYCNHWSEMGNKCKNDQCPTNQWKKNKQDEKSEKS